MKFMNHPIFRAGVKRSNGKAAAGYSLIETMISIVVLAIGLLAVGSMQISAFKGNTIANSITQEMERARDTLEKLRGLPYDHELLEDKNGDGVAGLDNMYPTHGVEEYPSSADYAEAEGRFNIYWNVVDDHPLPNTKRITVVVTSRVGGVLKATRLSTVRSDW
ncbi:MAG: prepilin-type N-terminal cleavage/methylation domain-containing protein [Deltaproteobacteria bacterium]|nr:prepilin-type N-terminal cleavage/methylation domain-containing protein [Deltaproteobacteria bacterium]